MKQAALALLLAVVATPAFADTPSDPRFDAFDGACIDGHRDPARRLAVVEAGGWKPVADDADPDLASMLAISRKAMKEADEEGYASTMAVYGQKFGGLDLYLVTNEVNAPKDAEWRIDFLGCSVYDFSATAPMNADIVSQRFDEFPAEVIDQPGTIVGQTWNVEKIDGVWSVQNAFVPPGSAGASSAGFSGVAIKMTSTRE